MAGDTIKVVLRSLRVCVLTAIACCGLVAQSTFTAPVTGISDGDTIKVLQDGVSKRVRLSSAKAARRSGGFT